MKNITKEACVSLIPFLVVGLVSPVLAAQDEDVGFSTGVEVGGSWDSNFSRTPIAEEEQITRTALNVKYSNTFSKQNLSSNLRFDQYDYQNQNDLDIDFLTGRFDWKGQIARKLLFDLNAARQAYTVDPLEFTGRDLVTKDDLVWRVGYGSRERLSIFIGGRDTEQRRSATERNILDFDEQELFLQARLRTATDWTHTLSVYDGDRNYPNRTDPLLANLNYDYRQYNYDIDWRATDKSRITLLIGRFERDGQFNDDTGTVLDATWNWQATDKLSLQMGYALRQPALGEEINNPIKEKNSLITVGWDISDKWRLETGAIRSDQTYRTTDLLNERQETYTRLRPLAVVFKHTQVLDVRFDTEIYDRDSTQPLRKYEGNVMNLRLKLSF